MDSDNSKIFQYVISPALKEAILTAEITQRPLLVRGEPGTGKTLLAEYLSKSRKQSIYKWHIKSTSLAKDGLYFYDAVSRLNDSRFTDLQMNQKVHNIENYIKLGALGEAFSRDENSVVLIDEIDKADIEFPNDLLLELDQMEFVVQETSRLIKAKKRPFLLLHQTMKKNFQMLFCEDVFFTILNFHLMTY